MLYDYSQWVHYMALMDNWLTRLARSGVVPTGGGALAAMLWRRCSGGDAVLWRRSGGGPLVVVLWW